MPFRIFDYLDATITKVEASAPKASRSPAAWPSEASAIRLDDRFYPAYGTCLLKAFYRLIGWESREQIDPSNPWKWVIGRAVEDNLTTLCAVEGADAPALYVANGIKHYVRNAFLAIEMDVIVRDPKTNRAWILECKTYDGYFSESAIEKDGKPKEENLIQLCIYLWEMKNGKILKETIQKSIEDRKKLDAIGKPHRNRSEAKMEAVESLDEGPLGAKLIYISRGECNRTEFDIEIFRDRDGFHYPMVNGIPYRIFRIESIYDRFRTLQKYWFRARQEAHDRLLEKGIAPPDTVKLLLTPQDEVPDMTIPRDLTKEQWAAEKLYYQMLESEVRSLPDNFFPKPEYEFAYTDARIKELFDGGVLGKTKMKDYQAGKLSRIGDWQCNFCGYAATGCVAKQRPDMAYMLYDIANLSDDVEVTIGS